MLTVTTPEIIEDVVHVLRTASGSAVLATTVNSIKHSQDTTLGEYLAGVESRLARIDGKATVIGLMTGYPSGIKDQWVAVLDAVYREASLAWGKYGTDLPNMVNCNTDGFTWLGGTITPNEDVSSIVSKASDPHTSKQNTDYMATNANGTDSQGVTGIQVAAHCRAIIINSSTAQLPNFQTLAFVFSRRAFVDENDPTATANTTRKLANWGFGSADGANVWASSESSDSSACFVASGGNLLGMYKYLRYGVVPVLEIPA